MPECTEIPLHLCQVLEEEYYNLHGELKPQKVRVEGRDVAVSSDWKFHKGHVDVPKLAAFLSQACHKRRLAWGRRRDERKRQDAGRMGELRASLRRGQKAAAKWLPKAGPALPEYFEDELADDFAAHLCYYFPGVLGAVRKVTRLAEGRAPRGGRTTAEAEQQLLDSLNALLVGEEEGLFPRRFFEPLRLRDETRELIRVGWEETTPIFMGDDRVRFRRLLLEDAFPGAFARVYDVRLARVLRAMQEKKQAALCFSGGGIRSATFSLGVLQGLAGTKSAPTDEDLHRPLSLLERFDYLSTVSGGGYTGSWLTAWAHRHRDGLGGVVDDLAPKAAQDKLTPEPEPLRHLRDYSNFLTPKKGLLTADTWTFIAIYLRNLLLNWSVFVPLLAGCLMLPRLLVALVRADPGPLVQTPALVLGTFLGGFGIAYMRLNRPSNSGAVKPGGFWDRRRDQSGFLRWCLLPLVVSTLLLTCYWAWTRAGIQPVPLNADTFLRFLVFSFAVWLLAWGFLAARSVIRYWHTSRRWRVLYDRLPQLGWHIVAALGTAAVLHGGSWVWNQIRDAKWLPARLHPLLYGPDDSPWFGFVMYGLLLGLVGSLTYVVFVFKSWWRQQRSLEIVKGTVWEVLTTVAACVTCALLLWALANTEFFRNPRADSPFDSTPVAQKPDEFKSKGSVGEVDFKVEAVKENPPKGGELKPITQLYAALASPLFLLTFLLGVTIFVGFTSRSYGAHAPALRRHGERKRGFVAWCQERLGSLSLHDEDREWLASFGAWVLIVVIGWIAFSLLVIFGPLAFYPNWKLITPLGTVASIGTILAANSAKTPARDKLGQTLWQAIILPNLLAVGSLVFVVLLVVVISFGTSELIRWLPSLGGGEALKNLVASLPLVSPLASSLPAVSPADYANMNGPAGEDGYYTLMRVAHYPPLLYLLALTAGLLLVGKVFSRLVNLNKFSLHAGYRDRLMRAYLGASRGRGERKPNPFTGFDPMDNVQMHELRPGLLSEVDFQSLEAFVLRLQRAKGHEMPDDKAKAAEAKADEAKADEANKAEEPEAPPRADVFLRKKITANDPATEWLLDNHRQGTEPSQSLKAALLEDLNRLLETEDLDVELGTPDLAGELKQIADEVAGLHAAPPESAGDADRQLRLLGRREQRLKKIEELRGIIKSSPPETGSLRVVLNRLLLDREYPEEVRPLPYPPPPLRLLHVVNMALNLVAGEKLAWQQRKAESFTTTMLHSGSFRVGYRRSRDYGGKDGISLATAATISGAAVNSNMGYYSVSAAVTFMLTFVNARLGWWLGNPGTAGIDTYYLASPRRAVSPVVDEAFGLTNDRNPYVLLSDGGHFENLGLYEMVLRRCHTIVVVDGSADPEGSFDDLGNAVRKIRIDFGIDIEFKSPPFNIYSRAEKDKGKAGGYCALGWIHYEDVDGKTKGATPDQPDPKTGHLIYIKPAFYGVSEPRDIYNYAQGNTKFPHDPTFPDQFFDESQFESYRKLGKFVMDELLDAAVPSRRVRAAGQDKAADKVADKVVDKFQDFFEKANSYVAALKPGGKGGSS